MKRKGSSDGSGAQSGNQQSGMAAPEAAAKADVEKLRDDHRQKIEDLRVRLEELQQEAKDLRAENEALRDFLKDIDQLVNKVYEYGATEDGEPPLNSEMPHILPENQTEEGPEVLFTRGGDDG
jgi:regulator of replication initiation timing